MNLQEDPQFGNSFRNTTRATILGLSGLCFGLVPQGYANTEDNSIQQSVSAVGDSFNLESEDFNLQVNLRYSTQDFARATKVKDAIELISSWKTESQIYISGHPPVSNAVLSEISIRH